MYSEVLSNIGSVSVGIGVIGCFMWQLKGKLKEYYLYQYIETELMEVCFAHDENGKYIFNIDKAVHTLVAGSTGSGKSVLLRALVTSLILKKSRDIDLYLVDFMRVELGIFRKSKYVKKFISDVEDFEKLLDFLKEESDRRLRLFEQYDVVNLKGWNKKFPQRKMKNIIIVIDEYAEICDDKKLISKLKKRISQVRKLGMSFIICTQRPSVDVIDGTIKSCIPSRISLKVTNSYDSKTILDESGAEKLRMCGNAIVKVDLKKEIQVMYLDEEQAIELVKDTFRKY